MTFIKRADLGRPLTWDELDSNFEQVDSYAAAASASASAAQTQAGNASQSAQQSAESATQALQYKQDAETAAAGAAGAVNAFKSNLAADDGEKYIGICPTIAVLRTINPTVNGQRITLREHTSGTGKGGGQFRAVIPGTGYIDNNGTVIRATGGAAWLRINADILNPLMFGAVANGRDDDADAFESAFNQALRSDVGGLDYSSKIFGGKIYIPSGMYEIKRQIKLTVNQTRFLIVEGDSELSSELSINNPDGFLDITCTARASAFEINDIGFLAKWGTASSQPGVGRDDFPATLSDVHDIPSGVAVKITYPAGISTVKSKSLKMRDVIMTGWNRYRGDFFSQGVSLVGGRNPTLERVVIEGKYGMLLSGRPDELFSNGTAFKFVDSYSPTLEDCYSNHYVRGFDLASVSTDPSYSTSEGGVIVRSAFDAMYGIRISLPGGEPQFNISNSHINYTRLGIELSGKNQVHIKDNLFYCEASVTGTVARDIVLRGTQKSQVTGNIFGKTNTGDRYCISLYKQATVNIPVTSLVINNNLYWAGASGTFRNFSFAGSGSASNVTIGDGECYEGSVSNLFTLGGSDHAAINPMKFCGDVAPEGTVWAPLGSLYTLRSTGAVYKKGGTLTSSNGWTVIP